MALSDVLAELQGKIGEEVHVSDWMTMTQEVIDQFANATGDKQWIHVDQKRAASDSPYGKTIAHGYLTLALYPQLRGLVDAEEPLFPGVTNVINYGLNKLRFTNAVKVGSKIRAHCTLIGAEEIKNSLQLTEQYSVEIKDEERPACVAECIMRVYF
jgi:acyl dehydratase